jgi:phosphoribosylformylglycinamidine synthase subunit PurQ / glutaminase
MRAKRVFAGVITGYGINADDELIEAFTRVGGTSEKVQVTDLMEKPERILTYDILGFAGGFSFGDHLGSGLVLAQLLKKYCGEEIARFIERGGPVIGICNGFQVLVKMGVLPNLNGNWEREVSLIHNDSGKFEDSWVTVEADSRSPCVWTKDLGELELPIRHGEGKFVTRDNEIMQTLESKGQIALRYRKRNPNGSQGDVAGITDATGRVLGLMPHPEAYLYPQQHPLYGRRNCRRSYTGLDIIRRGVEYI